MLRRSVTTAACGSEMVPRGRLRLLPRLRPGDDPGHDGATVPSVTLLKLTIVRLPLADLVIAPMTVRHWPRPGSEVSEECPPPPAPSSQPQGRRRHWSAGDTVARGLVCLATMALLKLTIVCLPLPDLRHRAHDNQALATPRLGGLGRVPASACSLVSAQGRPRALVRGRHGRPWASVPGHDGASEAHHRVPSSACSLVIAPMTIRHRPTLARTSRMVPAFACSLVSAPGTTAGSGPRQTRSPVVPGHDGASEAHHRVLPLPPLRHRTHDGVGWPVTAP